MFAVVQWSYVSSRKRGQNSLTSSVVFQAHVYQFEEIQTKRIKSHILLVKLGYPQLQPLCIFSISKDILLPKQYK